MEKERPFPLPIQFLELPYSPAVKWGDLIFFSGTLPEIKDGKPVSNSATVQLRQVLVKMESTLKESNQSFDDILLALIFLSGTMDDYQAINETYSVGMKGVKIMPARACFAVAALPFGAKVEILYVTGKKPAEFPDTPNIPVPDEQIA